METSTSGAQIIDGKAIAQTIREEVKTEVGKLTKSTGQVRGAIADKGALRCCACPNI